MKILSNKKYIEMRETIREYSKQINSLKYDLDNLKTAHYDLYESYNGEVNKLEDKTEETKKLIAENRILSNTIDELKAENKSLKAAKGGYASVMSKLKKDLEETQKKLEESMTDKYLVKRVPMGKLPKSQVMKMKSHAKQDKIIQKIYEKMEKDEI